MVIIFELYLQMNGWVELVRDLLSKSHKLYRGVIFQSMYGWFFPLNTFWHFSINMYFPFTIIILLFTCLGVVAVRTTMEELTKGWMLELNNIPLRKYVISLETQLIVLEIHKDLP